MSDKMTLEEKLRTINEPAIDGLPSGDVYAESIQDLFDTFVKPRLPEKEVIKKWHKLLMAYVADEKNLSCCVRYGNSGSKAVSSHGEKGYEKLRRGWVTQNWDVSDKDDPKQIDKFEYFFADNFFSTFIYKMALDGFVPDNVQELREAFQNRKFPYGFGFFIDKKYEAEGVVVPIGPEPGFLGNYKLSHIFDAGENFEVDGKVYGDAELSKMFYDIGHRDDFLKQSDLIRRMEITSMAKNVIIAKFLRFAHPFNYFLTPSKSHHTIDEKVYKNDIGEEPGMIECAKQYIQTTYPKEYKEFIECILWPKKPKLPKATPRSATERIGIHYGPMIVKDKISAKTNSPDSEGKITDPAKDFSKYQFNNKQYAKNRLVLVVVKKYVEDNPKTDFAALNSVFPDDLQGSKGVVKLSSSVSDKDKGVNGVKRYFVDDVIKLSSGEEILVCNQWSTGNIDNFINHIVGKLGYVITKA